MNSSEQAAVGSFSSKRNDVHVKFLEKALWQKFSKDYLNSNEFYSSYLALQCFMLGCAREGALFVKSEHQLQLTATWPNIKQTTLEPLVKSVELVMKNGQGVVSKVPESENVSAIALPIKRGSEILGVVTVLIETQNDAELTYVMRQLQWGASWVASHQIGLNSGKSLQTEKDNIDSVQEPWQTLLTLVGLSLDYERFHAAAHGVVSEWARLFGCERVSLAFVKGHKHKVTAISNSVNFDKRTNIVTQIESAMDEAFDQKQSLVFSCKASSAENTDSKVVEKSSTSSSPTTSNCTTVAHQRLAEGSGSGSVCSVLLTETNEQGLAVPVGAVTLEHPDIDYFDADRVALCEKIILAVGPLLVLKRRDDRWLIVKAAESLAVVGRKLVGFGHFSLKLSSLLAIAAIVLLAQLNIDYRVAADASIEGWTQRHVSPAMDGFIADSFHKAGDVVKAGDVLFTLDDQDMLLERLKWQSKREQLERQHIAALVEEDSAKAGIVYAQLAQAQVNLTLVNEQLKRTQVSAPFKGLIIAGDLSQKIGAPVKRGELLLQIAPLQNYRIILRVKERDITAIQVGQRGELKLQAISGEGFPFIIEKITPVSTAEEGANTFKVEASLINESDVRLRPGMEGKGKVSIAQRNAVWVWTHPLVHWFKVWLWSWWP